MDANFRKKLEENGADVEGTLQRFMGKESLYMKFIMRLPDDKNYEGVLESIDKQDYQKAFEFAHGLKGVSANLGLNPIRDIASDLTELLRNKESQDVDAQKAKELRNQLEEVYGCFIGILAEYQAQ